MGCGGTPNAISACYDEAKSAVSLMLDTLNLRAPAPDRFTFCPLFLSSVGPVSMKGPSQAYLNNHEDDDYSQTNMVIRFNKVYAFVTMYRKCK